MSSKPWTLVLTLGLIAGCDAAASPDGTSTPLAVAPAAPSAAPPGCECDPGAQLERACGSDVGLCHDGTQVRTCQASCAWSPWSECGGEAVQPVAEACGNQLDDDCDGEVDEGCACAPAAAGESGGFWVPGPMFDLVADPAGCRLYALAGGTTAELVVVDTAAKQEIARVDLGQASYDFDVSADGRWIVAAGGDGTSGIAVVQPPEWNVVRHVDTPATEVRSVAVSRAGRVYLLAHTGLYMVDLVTGAVDRSFGAVASWGQLELSPDERSLYVGKIGVTPGSVERFAINDDGTLARGSRSPFSLLVDLGFGDRSLAVSDDGRFVSYQGFVFDALDLSIVYGSTFEYAHAFSSTGRFGVDAHGVFDVELARTLGRTATYGAVTALTSGDQEMWSYDPLTETLHYANVADYMDPALLGRREWPAAPLSDYQLSRLVADPVRPWLYGLDARYGEVVIIDRATLTPVEGILVGTAATDMALDRGGRYLYVGHEYSWGLARIDLAELAFDGFQPTQHSSGSLTPLAAGRVASIGTHYDGYLQILDGVLPRVVNTYFSSFHDASVAASPDASQVFVVDSGLSNSCMTLFDASGDTLVKLREQTFLDCPDYPKPGLVLVPGTTDVFWAGARWRTSDFSRVYTIDAVPQAADVILTVTPDARLAISAGKVYDAATGAVRGTLPTASPAQALSPDGHTLYLGLPAGGIGRVDLGAF